MIGRQRGRRPLTEEERALWDAVARTASPLAKPPKPVRRKKPPAPAPAEPAAVAPRKVPAPPAPRIKPVRPSPPALPAAEPVRRRVAAQPEMLDRRTLGRVARGSIELDGRLDLHGLTQDEAHRRLMVFLQEIQRRGGRMVLVITGKGSDASRAERGVLRRAVPQWLSSAAFRPLVAAFDDAHRLHGGGGALYVRVRKVGGV